MVLVFSIFNFFTDKNSQGRKLSKCGLAAVIQLYQKYEKRGYLPDNFANFIQISIVNKQLSKRDLPQFKKAHHQKDTLQTTHLAKLSVLCAKVRLFIEKISLFDVAYGQVGL